MICIQKKFGQGPSTPIVLYRMLTHGDALNMFCNQYCRILKSWLSRCQDVGELNICPPPSTCQHSGHDQEPTDWKHQPSISFGIWWIFWYCELRRGSRNSSLVRTDHLSILKESIRWLGIWSQHWWWVVGSRSYGIQKPSGIPEATQDTSSGVI